MYYELLHILVFTQDQDFLRILQAVPAQAQFEHVFLPALPAFSALDCVDADVIIMDIPAKQIPPDIRMRCGSAHPQLIYCERGAEQRLEDSRLLAVMDALWEAPYSEERLTCFFQLLLRGIRQRKELWLAKNLLDTTIDSVPDLVWFKNVKGAHLKVNQSFCDMVGKTKQQCYNRGHYYIWDIDAEEYAQGEYVCLESEDIVMQKKKTCVFDEKVKKQNGEMVQFTTYKSPIFDEDGALIGTMGIARDVTDWKNMTAEIGIILNSLASAAMLVDREGHIFMANTMVRKVFGCDPKALAGQDYARWKMLELQQEQPLQQGEHRLLEYNSQGEHLFLSMREEPLLDVFQQPVGCFVIFQDVTEHKKHLELLENYQKELESNVRMKTRTINDIQRRIFSSFADLVTSRDSATGDHIRNTSRYVDILLDELCREGTIPALNDGDFCQNISRAVPLHDIGKIAIPDAVLKKQGKYTAEEYALMRRHAELGGRILAKTLAPLEDFQYYKVAADMAVYHHERWDGQGYPRGLQGENIPVPARIMAVADVFDSLISNRPFHQALTIEQAYVIIKANAGTQFDPVVAAAFIMARPQIERSVRENVYRNK